MVTLDLTDGILFSADAFGSFIALDGKLFADEVNFDRDWLDEARRYYTNIVGKYGPHVQHLLGKAAKVLDKIKVICPLHGPVWRDDFPYLLDKYQRWSTVYTGRKRRPHRLFFDVRQHGSSCTEPGSKLCEKGVTKYPCLRRLLDSRIGTDFPDL